MFRGTWWHAIEEAKILKQPKYPTVSFKMDDKQVKKKSKTSASAPPPPARLTADGGKPYTNARRT